MNAVATYLVSLLALVQDRVDDRNDRGATAVEYGLLVGLIAVVIIAVVTALGGQLQLMFQAIVTALGG